MREEFEKIYKARINRPGADAMLQWLQKSDFFTAPASTKYHGAEVGGLCAHSVNVYNRLRELYIAEKARRGEFDMTDMEEDTLAVCGLLHDVCKVDFYERKVAWVKNENGQRERSAYYVVNDKMPYGHGEKSVYIVSGFMKLSREEAFAIRYHMGGWNSDEKQNCGRAFGMYMLATLTHIADMMATYIDEN